MSPTRRAWIEGGSRRDRRSGALPAVRLRAFLVDRTQANVVSSCLEQYYCTRFAPFWCVMTCLKITRKNHLQMPVHTPEVDMMNLSLRTLV